MKTSEDACPLTDYRANVAEYLRQVQETGRPLIVTQDGEPAGIVLSPAYYNELMDKIEQAETIAGIKEGLADVKNGRVRDSRESIRDIAAKHGLKLR